MRSLVTQLLTLAWPVALARLGIMTMGVCDSIVVGQLAPDELSHQALGWAPTAVWMVASIGLLMGVQVLAARSLGAAHTRDVGGALQCGLVIAALAGAAAIAFGELAGEHVYRWFGVAPELALPAARVMRVLMFSVPCHLIYVCGAYFVEAIGRPMVSTWVMWLGNLVNLGMNLWLVPKHGALGSAWATVAARAVLALSLMVWIVRLPNAAELGLRRRSVGLGYKEFLRVGLAAAVSQAAEAGAFSGMTILAARQGGQAVAAYQIVLNILSLVFMCALGMATATSVLASRAVGRDDGAAAARVSWFGLVLNSLVIAVLALGAVLFAQPIAHAYTAAPEIVVRVVALLPLAASAMLADGGQAVVAAGLRAQRDNWFPTASHLMAYAVVMPALGVTLADMQGLGIRGLLLAIIWASFLSVSVLMLRLWALTARTAQS